jgi:hypothetical protein
MPKTNPLAPTWREAAKVERDIILNVLRSLCDFEPGSVLDVGAGETGYGGLFSARRRLLVSLDVDLAARPKVVGSALALPFRDQGFDTIVSTQTLEQST